jgi:four helix bundle protein
MAHFDQEKLDVYNASTDFVACARGRAYLADELQRAATSIVLNIAEGAGEFSRKDKARFSGSRSARRLQEALARR